MNHKVSFRHAVHRTIDRADCLAIRAADTRTAEFADCAAIHGHTNRIAKRGAAFFLAATLVAGITGCHDGHTVDHGNGPNHDVGGSYGGGDGGAYDRVQTAFMIVALGGGVGTLGMGVLALAAGRLQRRHLQNAALSEEHARTLRGVRSEHLAAYRCEV